MRHKARLEKLQALIMRRATIETRMITSIRNMENAITWADKALESSLKRRLHALEKPNSIRSSLRLQLYLWHG